MMSLYTPVSFERGRVKVPVRYAKESPNYEGYHEPFWVMVSELTAMLKEYAPAVYHSFERNFAPPKLALIPIRIDS